MSIVLIGSTSGSITLQEPAVAGSNTINFPAATGTAILADGSNNLQMNSGYGSNATAYGCRAWVNFNGTGTVAIRASGNVSSITDEGTGDYRVNFATAMPDANYAPAFMIRTSTTVRFETAVIRGDVDPTTGYIRFVTGMSTYGVENYQMDTSIVNVSIFR